MVRIYDSLKPTSQAEIAAFEEWAEVKLPEAYKRFLLKTNGGFCQPAGFKYDDPAMEFTCGDTGRLLGIGDPEDSKSLYKWVQPGAAMIPIALDAGGNMLFLGVAGEDRGKVYYWLDGIHPLDQDTFFVANDFDAFLAGLQDCTEDGRGFAVD